MALPLFFEENLSDANQFTLSEDSSRHIVQVLRMQEGEQLLLTNGRGLQLTVEIEVPHKKKTGVKIKNKEFILLPQPSTAIAVSIIKNSGRFEWFLEKATEIGISQIIPLISTRTERTHFREERMKTILISAMLQSRQVWLPELSAPIKISELMQNGIYEQKFIAHCIDEEKKVLDHSTVNKTLSRIVLIGPEGDFTEEEIKAAIQNNYIPVSLGETRLRTETAALVAAVLLK